MKRLGLLLGGLTLGVVLALSSNAVSSQINAVRAAFSTITYTGGTGANGGLIPDNVADAWHLQGTDGLYYLHVQTTNASERIYLGSDEQTVDGGLTQVALRGPLFLAGGTNNTSAAQVFDSPNSKGSGVSTLVFRTATRGSSGNTINNNWANRLVIDDATFAVTDNVTVSGTLQVSGTPTTVVAVNASGRLTLSGGGTPIVTSAASIFDIVGNSSTALQFQDDNTATKMMILDTTTGALAIKIASTVATKFGGGTSFQRNAGLTAGTTQTIAGGVPLVAGTNQISVCANTGDAATLPVSDATYAPHVVVQNDGAQTAKIFPGEAGTRICLTNSVLGVLTGACGANGAAVTLLAAAGMVCDQVTTAEWTCQ